MHAAQNEMLPLRVVVQVLFFEQARAAKSGGKMTELPVNIKELLATHGIDPSGPSGPLNTTASIHAAEEQWSVSGFKSSKSKMPTLRMKLAEDGDTEYPDGSERTPRKLMSFSTMRTQPKRMLSKLWSINRSASEKN